MPNNAALGVVSFTDRLGVADLESYALHIEALGYDSMWVPELLGREPLSTVAFLLARTRRLCIGTGIANVYARDAMNAAQARQTLAELSGGRFQLGLGVSHPPMAEARGHTWVMPLPKLRAYLETLRSTEVQSPRPAQPAPVLIAAHGPKLLALAAQAADGALTYLMPPEHTRWAREILGMDRALATLLPFCLDEDRERALANGRRALAMYLALPAYRRVWQTLGLEDADFETGGSERLLDAVGAFGNEERVRERIERYRAAGASQVLLSPLHGDTERPGGALSRRTVLERLAPARG